MSKYHFIFEDRLGNKLVEYDSDVEPPHIGEIVQFNDITNDKIEDIYRVRDVWYSSLNQFEARILFEVEKVG